MPAKCCVVSFTDEWKIRHSVEVAAASLYEAAVLALVEFGRGVIPEKPNASTKLTVEVKMPATTHEVEVLEVNLWLKRHGSPKEVAERGRLKALLDASDSR